MADFGAIPNTLAVCFRGAEDEREAIPEKQTVCCRRPLPGNGVYAGERLVHMSDRSSESTVTFQHPFSLSALDKPLPAGRYLVVTEEDEIAGVSFQAFHRTATLLHLPAIGTGGTMQQVVTVNPDELDVAQRADRQA